MKINFKKKGGNRNSPFPLQLNSTWPHPMIKGYLPCFFSFLPVPKSFSDFWFLLQPRVVQVRGAGGVLGVSEIEGNKRGWAPGNFGSLLLFFQPSTISHTVRRSIYPVSPQDPGPAPTPRENNKNLGFAEMKPIFIVKSELKHPLSAIILNLVSPYYLCEQENVKS